MHLGEDQGRDVGVGTQEWEKWGRSGLERQGWRPVGRGWGGGVRRPGPVVGRPRGIRCTPVRVVVRGGGVGPNSSETVQWDPSDAACGRTYPTRRTRPNPGVFLDTGMGRDGTLGPQVRVRQVRGSMESLNDVCHDGTTVLLHPFGVKVRPGDDEWVDVERWTLTPEEDRWWGSVPVGTSLLVPQR